VNHNAEAVIMVMRPPETTVQLVLNAVNGVGSMPGVGSMSPRLIPAELSGMALCNFFDARGIPTRNSVPVYLPGNTPIGISQSPLQGPPRVSAPPKLPAATQPAAVPSPAVTVGQPFQAQAAPSQPIVQHSPPAHTTSTQHPAESDDEAQDDPNLARELALAKVSQIRSATLQHEEKAGIEIERERLAVTKESTHTREVAEAFQLNSMMRRELLATQSAYREEAQRMLQTMDIASRRVLEMADMVAERLKDPRFAPMPQPPPPPPDYVGIFGGVAQRALDIYMSAQLKARKRRKRKSFEWDQLEDLATELLRAQQAQPPPPPPAQSAALDDDDDDDDGEGDEDDNDLLLRRILSSKTEAASEAENKTAPPPLDPKANRELEEFLKSETALDLLAKLAAKKASKPSP